MRLERDRAEAEQAQQVRRRLCRLVDGDGVRVSGRAVLPRYSCCVSGIGRTRHGELTRATCGGRVRGRLARHLDAVCVTEVDHEPRAKMSIENCTQPKCVEWGPS